MRDRDQMPGETQPSQQIGIGVLPFVNLSGDAERHYLTHGLTEESIATLGQIDPEHFSVIGRTTMMAYRETKRTLTEIGREQSTRLSSGNSKTLSLRGYIAARVNRAWEARAILDTLHATAKARFVPPYAMTLVYVGLRETDLVFEWLRRAEKQNDVHLIF